MIRFILGGARSGKSRLAEQWARRLEQQGNAVYYVATAQAFDEEMKCRIEHHQHQRPSHWKTYEEPIHLAAILDELSQQPCVVLVDCLTLWVNNLLMCDDECVLAQQVEYFLGVLKRLPAHCELILVSNEVGLGIVPLGELSRRFVDESGFLHQKIAQVADCVQFCAAGLHLTLKGEN